MVNAQKTARKQRKKGFSQRANHLKQNKTPPIYWHRITELYFWKGLLVPSLVAVCLFVCFEASVLQIEYYKEGDESKQQS